MKMIVLTREVPALSAPEPIGASLSSGPTLYIHKTGEKLKFPEEGTAVIKFKKRHASMSKHDGGEPEYSCELEVLAIGDIKGTNGKKKPSGAEALDSLMKEKEDEYEEEDED